MSCGVGRRRGSDSVLLWLWHRPVATALIRPLAGQLPYAECVALKRQEKKNLALFETVNILITNLYNLM